MQALPGSQQSPYSLLGGESANKQRIASAPVILLICTWIRMNKVRLDKDLVFRKPSVHELPPDKLGEGDIAVDILRPCAPVAMYGQH